jgi:hypothetical protein
MSIGEQLAKMRLDWNRPPFLADSHEIRFGAPPPLLLH